MLRKIIQIDEEKCNGCGLCIPNCHEGALRVIDGKARLISDLFCDGLGACLGHCPEGAIEIIEREAEAYDEVKVMEEMAGHLPVTSGHACPGTIARDLRTEAVEISQTNQAPATSPGAPSELRQWPVQLHLLNPQATYFKHADVVLAADCAAFAMGDFHSRFLKGKSLAIACPKLDSNKESYIEKLTSMIAESGINTLTVIMMEVPCCGGLLQISKMARDRAKRKIPIKKAFISIKGELISEEWE
jgi:NAD-dependent dihydropyrimidine dehydrogenase PreA subunit